MPGPRGPWGDQLVAAVRAGSVPETIVDDKVVRLLRLARRVGALNGGIEHSRSTAPMVITPKSSSAAPVLVDPGAHARGDDTVVRAPAQ